MKSTQLFVIAAGAVVISIFAHEIGAIIGIPPGLRSSFGGLLLVVAIVIVIVGFLRRRAERT